MGGTLTARSDGLGKGAEFTLELPVAVIRPSVQNTPQHKESWYRR